MSIVTFGPIEDAVRLQIDACVAVEDGAQGVLCADNHLGYSMPIGGVVGYRDLISPSAVGYDIACGNCAVKTDAKLTDIRDSLPTIMDDIAATISFGVGRANAEHVDDPILDEIAECALPFQREMAAKAAAQLGTVGSGNHFVDLFVDADDFVWIGVHFGSRGFGHTTATWALNQIESTDQSMMAPPAVIDASSELGQMYIDGMERAGRYAYAGRGWVVDRIRQILGADELDRVHNHHNFAWREVHQGVPLWVHRKGATPAFPGQRGFVGATMGEASVILSGVDSPTSQGALYSTVHGAGRVLSRTAAAGKIKRSKEWRCNRRECALWSAGLPITTFQGKDLRTLKPVCPSCALGEMCVFKTRTVVRPGCVDFDAVRSRIRERGIELRGAGADEAPECYKRLSEVLDYHAGTVVVETVLEPIGVVMAGPEVNDPYKD